MDGAEKLVKKKKVLLIDDEEEVVDSTTLLLQRCGCQVFAACERLEIYNILQSNKIDVVILDLNVPNIVTREVAVGAKKINKKTKVIWFSGLEITDLEKENGLYDGFLCKPFSLSDLKKII